MADGTLLAEILADATQFNRETEGVMGKMKQFGATLTAAVTLPIIGLFAASVKAASDSETAIAQLNAVLKSTRGVAGVTAKAAQDLASSLQLTTRYSDEATLGAESMLLTFTNINKNIFPETTKLALDMSTALGQDLKSSAIQLGKALNDPIKGITALRRVGVAFTEAQMKEIKALQQSGNLLGAQKIILQELQREFGGSAVAAGNTFAGSLDKLKNSLDEVMEKIGKIIIDAITPFIQKVATFVTSLQNVNPELLKIGVVALAVVAAIGPLLGILGAIGTVLGIILSPIGLIIIGLVALAAAFATNFLGIRDAVMPIVDVIKKAIDLFMAQLGQFIKNVQKVGLGEALLSALNLGDGKKYMTGWIQGVLEALGVGKTQAALIVTEISAGIRLIGQAFATASMLGLVLSFTFSQLSRTADQLVKISLFGLFDILNKAAIAAGQLGLILMSALMSAVNFINARIAELNKTIQDLVDKFNAARTALAQGLGLGGNPNAGKPMPNGGLGVQGNANPNGNWFSNLFGGIFGGGRAAGGPVNAGSPYIVGERGPELFTPNRSGSISPNGGYSGPSTFHVTLSLDEIAEHMYFNVGDMLRPGG